MEIQRADTPEARLRRKHERLVSILREYGSVVVAFSGGARTMLLARAALDVLGPAAVLAVTAGSSEEPGFAAAADAARRFGIPHAGLRSGRDDFWTQLVALAGVRGYEAVVDGATADEDGAPEDGASVELGVRSPLREAGLTAAEAYELARRAGLATGDAESPRRAR